MGSESRMPLPIAITANQVTSCLYPDVLRFRLDPIVSHSLFGTANELEGEIPFLGPTARLRVYLNHLDTNPHIIADISKSILSKYREGYPNDTDDEILTKVQNQLRTLLLIGGDFGDGKAGNARRAAFGELLCMTYVFDGVVDAVGDGAAEHIDLVEMDYVGQLANWMSSPRPLFLSLPSGTADVERVKQTMQRAMDEMEKALGPDADRWFLEMRDDIIQVISSHIIAHVIGAGARASGGVRFSEATMIELWRPKSGVKFVAGLLPRMKNIWLSQQVQMDQLFHITLHRAADISVEMNAILGLSKDAHTSEVDSPLTHSVVHSGMLLTDAFKRTMSRIHSLYSDYSLASSKLVELYASREPNVKGWVEQISWALDAMLYGYHIIDKYGLRDKTIVAENPNFA